MNMFDYRRKKDLQGRTTEFRRNERAPARPQPAPAPRPAASNNKPAPAPTPYGSAGGKKKQKIRNRSKDRWVYNPAVYANIGLSNKNPLDVPARTGESKHDYDERKQEYRHLLGDWFPNETIRNVFRHHPVHILYIARPLWFTLPFVLILTVVGFFIPLVGAFTFLLWIAEAVLIGWFIMDWYNDYLIITSHRAIQLKKIPFIDTEKTEIPLEKIQDLKVASRRNVIEYMFRVGSITLMSTGKTTIDFERVKMPDRIRQEFNDLRKQFMLRRSEDRKERMRNYLAHKIWNEPLRSTAEANTRTIEVNDDPNWFERTFPGGPLRNPENKTEIMWHTHPWILIRKATLSVLLFFLILIGGGIALPFIYGLGIGWLGLTASLVYLFSLLVLMAVVWYTYENWHNDRYFVGPEKIRDIIKLPFGFDETVGVIDIRNIQDAQYAQVGLIPNLLNYGTVIIKIVGGTGVELKDVPDPEAIRDEIAWRQEQVRFFDEDRQDRLYADFFATYGNILINPPDMENNFEPGPGGYNNPNPNPYPNNR